MKELGFNPLQYDCYSQGCFNLKKRPKIEIFCECFPGRISFGDVDGIVETYGNALLLEWKPSPIVFRRGQQIMYERITRGYAVSVICVAGDAETMLVSHRGGFVNGRQREWKPATLQEVKHAIKGWASWSMRHPRFR